MTLPVSQQSQQPCRCPWAGWHWQQAQEWWQVDSQVCLSPQNEVTLLRNEVAQLKQLLLAHKDCPVTALQKKTQGYLGE